MKKGVLVSCIMAVCFLLLLKFVQSALPQQEVEAVEEILSSMGATNWRFNGEICQLQAITKVQKLNQEALASVQCDDACNNLNSSNCHVISITHKFYSLGGVLPSALVKLPNLQTIDFAYNYLSGRIPAEWAATRLQSISLLGNRLTGEIPRELANITSLTYLNLEGNQFSGEIHSDLGRLSRLETLIFSSNQLMGTLPTSFSALRNLKDLINDNNLSGPIPDLIQNWRQLTRLELIGTGLQGPIPSNISLLENLTELRISDLNGPSQKFPSLNNASGILRVLLRNCNISGEIPAYIWQRRDLQFLDVSFNQLVGEISSNIIGRSLRYVFLTGNMLSGNVPDTLLIEGATIDLSYNNFTWQGPDQPSCRPNMNLYLNLFRSSSTGKTLQDVLPCETNIVCPKYECSLHVNSGGYDVWVRENNVEVLYEGDASFNGDAAGFYRGTSKWGISSTGDFLDDNIQTGHYIGSLEEPTNLPPLYTTARLSPLSLTYVSYCLENGNYLINLHFAEIQFTNDSTYRNLGKRLFDIYIQGKRVKRDFNIENEAHGIQKAVVIPFNASVVNNSLEIRLYWAGKGTTRIPRRGVYGPLISAISVNPYFKTCSIKGKKKSKVAYVIFGIMGLCIVLFILAALWWKGCLKFRKGKDKDFKGLELNTVSYSLKQLETATNNFNGTNKIGEGGFGPVYKGVLPNGTVIAVKQLSSHSSQGNREFLNEIALISCLQHPNLVKLHGCCIEGDQLMLVYEYLENNNLANALFGSHNSSLTLDWPTRFKICVGIAKGLAFLHEESRLKIVHRDIKATNVLLDKDLNPKISDFGLARLHEDDKSHISTRVAGTIGYMAPEYALWGHLSEKADVYSFGVVALEIVSGKNNNLYIPKNGSICLLDWACRLQTSKMYDELFDENLGSHIIKEEAETVVKVALLCTDGSPSRRPTMSEVVSMLEGRTSIPEIVPTTTGYTEDLRFKAMRDFHERLSQSQFSNTNQASISTSPLTTGIEIQRDERLSGSQSHYSNISIT
uniref:probable LRR receptor-like serine/threonine-protein kinase RFK1 isoform X2 n=1 Tax=Erigeron canadensis TaxID=72917 RepID=UPI001CB9681E|nr:probable LRR receptor-like serine/threonine-protein kinase RFK1 isoform X2 [Erigeron canadensis]